jgi:hypothetical protein
MNIFEKMSDNQLIMAALFRILSVLLTGPSEAKLIKDELVARFVEVKREDWI